MQPLLTLLHNEVHLHLTGGGQVEHLNQLSTRQLEWLVRVTATGDRTGRETRSRPCAGGQQGRRAAGQPEEPSQVGGAVAATRLKLAPEPLLRPAAGVWALLVRTGCGLARVTVCCHPTLSSSMTFCRSSLVLIVPPHCFINTAYTCVQQRPDTPGDKCTLQVSCRLLLDGCCCWQHMSCRGAHRLLRRCCSRVEPCLWVCSPVLEHLGPGQQPADTGVSARGDCCIPEPKHHLPVPPHDLTASRHFAALCEAGAATEGAYEPAWMQQQQ